MPHITLEYSANLKDEGDFKSLCGKLAKCLAEQRSDGKPVYPLGGIRVRALEAADYAIADDSLDAAFVHAVFKIAPGRSEHVRQATGDALFDIIKAHFEPLYQRRGLALSMELIEFSETGAWKHNNLHARLKKQDTQPT